MLEDERDWKLNSITCCDLEIGWNSNFFLVVSSVIQYIVYIVDRILQKVVYFSLNLFLSSLNADGRI